MSETQRINVGWVVADIPKGKDRLVKVAVHDLSIADQRMICPMFPVEQSVLAPAGLQRGIPMEAVLPNWALVPKDVKYYPQKDGKAYIKMDDIVAWEWEGLDEKTKGFEGMH